MPSGERQASTSRRRPKRSYHHGDLKRALTVAALELVAEKGPKGFSLAEAARRAGVSSAAPYRHFANKDELLAAVAEQGFEDLHRALLGLRRRKDPVAQIVALSVVYVRWAVANPEFYEVMFASRAKTSEHQGWMAAGERTFGVLLAAIASGQQADVLAGEDPRTVAGPVWALLHGLASLHVGGDLRHMGIVESVQSLAARSVAALLANQSR